MLILYHGGGAGDLELEGELSPELWAGLRRRSISYLNQVGHIAAASLLETLPFELWEGINKFGDRFEVLVARLGVSKYLTLSIDAENDETRHGFGAIAQIVSELGNNYIRFIVAEATDDDMAVVTTPTLATTSGTVIRALGDFEALIRAGGAVSGVDRVHTALHGYMLEICNGENIPHNDEADITALFKLIRQHHPKFNTQPSGTEPQKVFRGLAQVVDAMNPVRNHNSMAHPNEVLLEEPEAMLVVNSARSLMHYLNMKLR